MNQGIFRAKKQLILASASPRRQALLASLGIDFFVEPSKINEPKIMASELVHDYVSKIALLKGLEIARKNGQGAVISADTVVELNGKIFGKPDSKQDAFKMLVALTGQTHTVYTAVALFLRGEVTSLVCSTEVKMRLCTSLEIEAYVRTNESMDKAGSYAIQGIGGFMIEKIDGSHSNVVGFPMAEITELLLKYDIISVAK